MDQKIPQRCPWAITELGIAYHDREWGVPVHEDQRLFEFLVLEGAQAGLSWETILRKRENYREAFAGFDPEKVAPFNARRIERLLSNPGIVRNRLKITAAVDNARQFLKIQNEFGSFDAFIWRFAGDGLKREAWRTVTQVPSKTPDSDRMSRELVQRSFRFVGSTICYAFMQAVGMVNDHLERCFRYDEIVARVAVKSPKLSS
ncbi:MAG: DNA-3-methyladenine glycosylase I [Terriglobia bacterium]